MFSNTVKDGLLSENVYIGVSSLTGNDPGNVSIIDVADTIFLSKNEISTDAFWARVDNNNKLGTIWIEVKSPNYNIIHPEKSGQREMNLPKHIYNIYNDKKDQYEWKSFSGFEEPGTYQILYFAQDSTQDNPYLDIKHISSPMATTVYKAKSNNNSPSEFSLISPDNNEIIHSENQIALVNLKWENSFDNDRFSYTVILSNNENFNNNVNKFTMIPYNTFLLKISEWENVFWKVLAIDEFGSKTESQIKKFHIKYMSTPENIGWITGHVYNKDTNSILKNVQIKAVDQLGKVYKVELIQDGYYMNSLPPLIYTVIAESNGYFSLSIPNIMVEKGKYVNINLGLHEYLRRGDYNGDGTVDLKDIIYGIQILINVKQVNPIFLIADITQNDQISLDDIVAMLIWIASK